MVGRRLSPETTTRTTAALGLASVAFHRSGLGSVLMQWRGAYSQALSQRPPASAKPALLFAVSTEQPSEFHP